MPLRPLSSVPYLPFLSLRPSEMRALEELPNKTKDRLLPVVHLRPWTTAFMLQASLDRLQQAYGDRPTVIAIGPPEQAGALRPVHSELARLRLSGGGYQNWCDFIADTGHEHFIPAVQLEDVDHLSGQLTFFHQLGRGLFVIVPRPAYVSLRPLAAAIGQLTDGGRDTCIILDEEVASRDSLERAAILVGHCRAVQENCPNAIISISGSSFPEQFTSIVRQDIFERLLFDQVAARIGQDRMIFSDRGSARVERQRGGGGQPAPRIDYPQAGRWSFFRSSQEGFAGYRDMALEVQRQQPPIFDASLRVWGTLMIERTANNDSSAIRTPARSTAVRINLHLQRQTFFNDPISLYDTEDDWAG